MLVPASGFTRLAVEAEADDALAERDPVAAAVNLFDRGTYFQCNFEPDTAVESAPCQVLMSVKAARPGSQVCEAARGLTDTSRTGLLVLGKAGLGTKFHVDRTEAENVAFSVIDKPKVYRDPYSLMCCACTCFKVGALTMHTAFNLADCNFASSILPLLPNVHDCKMQSFNAQYFNDAFTGEVKGNKTWEPGSVCACKVVVCAPTCGTKIC